MAPTEPPRTPLWPLVACDSLGDNVTPLQTPEPPCVSGAESPPASGVTHRAGGGGPLGTTKGSNQYGEVSYEADLTATQSRLSSLTFAFPCDEEACRTAVLVVL